jgi:hypothetical protein
MTVFMWGLLAWGHFAPGSLLGGIDYQIEIVATAKERRQPFDMVLLDAQMPVLDGLERTGASVSCAPTKRSALGRSR